MTNVVMNELSRTISRALRHEPWIFELEVDDEGWVQVPQLLDALRCENDAWEELGENDIAEMFERRRSNVTKSIVDGFERFTVIRFLES